MTPRAWRLKLPFFIISFILGVLDRSTPSGLRPSTPMTMTCLALGSLSALAVPDNAVAPSITIRPAPVMSDLSLARYLGYAALPEAATLHARLEQDARTALDHGIHLIVVQSADGSLIVGDSHHYAQTPDPFSSEAVDAEILRQYEAVLGPAPPVVERWTGTFASAAGHSVVRRPDQGVT